MNRLGCLSFLLFVGCLPLSAQVTESAGTSSLVLQPAPSGFNCPITMRAIQAVGGGMLTANESYHPGLGQLLDLSIVNPTRPDIVAARITAHGFGAKGRIRRTRSNSAGSSEVTTTLDVHFKAEARGDGFAELWLADFTAVGVLDVDSVTYADGSTWHSSERQTCHVSPDGLMLISSNPHR